ncbi:hypothetical protein [Allokutzneria sp. NRRL B-24872]|uniref:hypothetical protein n=1 Tax=Allokutzneria sp. NRRL B-24872 TaxID=1137961 RepID=UPI00143D2B97|nr:hypothetical protein [Allokutzneria sp. NRRL B-24872]
MREMRSSAVRSGVPVVCGLLLLGGCSSTAPEKYLHSWTCFPGVDAAILELMAGIPDAQVDDDDERVHSWGGRNTQLCSRTLANQKLSAESMPEQRTVSVSYFVPLRSRGQSDSVGEAKEEIRAKGFSSESRRPLDLGEEGYSWNYPEVVQGAAGGEAAFQDSNLVAHVRVGGTDYGPDGKSRPLDPVKAEQDAIRILRAIKEKVTP